ncbi:hypothetical protein [Trueperella bialowiezensis]|uniref:Uncharacterized protein n=1 Tax=Trueperella bialowiezensis TaxID=312285 RepID=A0A3S4Z6F1_9ACTO|nr:hypothetical protein [Trueperella bialowiezensis]VEI14061.1 Uncharacterised protein [Trueperella bialowiezensis]
MEEHFLEAIGYLPDWQANLTLIDRSALRGVQTKSQWEHVVVYNDPSGSALSLFQSTDGVSGESFTVHGTPRICVEAWQLTPGLVELTVMDEQGDVLTKILAQVDDPHMYPLYPLKAVGEPARYDDYYLGAIAVDVDVFDNEDAWKKTQTPLASPTLATEDVADGFPGEMYIGPRFVTSPWLFAVYGGDATAEEASAISMFKAVCKDVEIVVNQLTGKQWYRIHADCSIPVTLALPITTTPAPKVGSIVDGKVFLTGTTGFWLDHHGS